MGEKYNFTFPSISYILNDGKLLSFITNSADNIVYFLFIIKKILKKIVCIFFSKTPLSMYYIS